MISKLKQAIGHEAGCAVNTYCPSDAHNDATCNCSRREMIAWLERLENPTEKMIQAMRFTNRKTLRGQLLARFKAGIKAAEENA